MMNRPTLAVLALTVFANQGCVAVAAGQVLTRNGGKRSEVLIGRRSEVLIRGNGKSKTETRALGAISKISVTTMLHLKFVRDKEQSMTVQADENIVPYIITERKGDHLIIGLKDSTSYDSKLPMVITVHSPNLKELIVSGASKADVQNIDEPKLKLEVSGVSNVQLQGAVRELKAEISGASNLTLRVGNVSNSVINLSGASKIAAEGEWESPQIELSGASKLDFSKGLVRKGVVRLSGVSVAHFGKSSTFSGSTSGLSKILLGNTKVSGSIHGMVEDDDEKED